jgi:phage tail-like protein
MSGNNSVPFGSFGFKVLVTLGDGKDSKGTACFQEVSGLSASLNVEDVVEGGRNNTTRKMIGVASFSNITLKRGLCSDTMFKWIKSYIEGNFTQRMSGCIQLLGDDGKPVKEFKFKNGIPVKWDGPSLSVSSDAIATESLEIAHEGLELS